MAAAPHAWDPALYAAHAAFVPALGNAALALLDPQPGEDILDIGCGDGVLTARIADSGARVSGIDADPAMVAAARAKGLTVELRDARQLAAVASYDAVFSNAALHWIGAPDLVSAHVFRALKPGGRYVGEFGGHANIAAIRVALRAVLAAHGFAVEPVETSYYPTAEAFTTVLETAGFRVATCAIIPRPTPVPSMADWLETFRGGFIDSAGVPPDRRDAIIADTVALLRPVLADGDGGWVADYVRLRFVAHKPRPPEQD